jgi:hypothetical protein
MAEIDPDGPARTRRALHGVAELVLAGPQYRAAGTIRLRIVAGGFATVGEPSLAVLAGAEGCRLAGPGGEWPIAGSTCAALAGAAGVGAGAPVGVYGEGSGVAADEPLALDEAVAAHLAGCLATGELALRTFAPDRDPVLWPEHFDLAIGVDGAAGDGVNYGVSLGDDAVPEPYAYVGPWRRREGEFWNVPFGAARPLRLLGGADGVAGFFRAGARAAAG